MTIYRNLFLIISSVFWISITGCSSKNSEFFILNTAKFSTVQQYKGCRNNIMIENIKIPGYIDKPEIVTRVNQNQLFQAEFHRWAEPLSGNIRDVIAQNLSSQLSQDRILTYPKLTTSNVNYYLAVKVNQFDVDSRGISILKVTWSIYNFKRKLIITKNSTYHFYTPNPNKYADITYTMNKNITALSSDIALHLNRLERRNGSICQARSS